MEATDQGRQRVGGIQGSHQFSVINPEPVSGTDHRIPSPSLKDKTDILIAGAGFSGMVLAERFAAHGLKCVVVEKRPHIGGNAWDCADRNGVLYHPYGPHYFRTNSHAVREYLSRFTEWQHVDYRIQSWTDGRYWSFPVNLT